MSACWMLTSEVHVISIASKLEGHGRGGICQWSEMVVAWPLEPHQSSKSGPSLISWHSGLHLQGQFAHALGQSGLPGAVHCELQQIWPAGHA